MSSQLCGTRRQTTDVVYAKQLCYKQFFFFFGAKKIYRSEFFVISILDMAIAIFDITAKKFFRFSFGTKKIYQQKQGDDIPTGILNLLK